MTEQQLNNLLARYSGIVRTICCGILTGRREDAEEAQADTFVKLWQSRNLPADEGHLRSYVIRTARSCAIDRYRRIRKQGGTFPLEEQDDNAFCVELESSLESQELIDLIQTLPPPDGELFLRRYLYCEPSALLAEYFQMPDCTIRTRLHRAKNKLQNLLRKEHYYE